MTNKNTAFYPVEIQKVETDKLDDSKRYYIIRKSGYEDAVTGKYIKSYPALISHVLIEKNLPVSEVNKPCNCFKNGAQAFCDNSCSPTPLRTAEQEQWKSEMLSKSRKLMQDCIDSFEFQGLNCGRIKDLCTMIDDGFNQFKTK